MATDGALPPVALLYLDQFSPFCGDTYTASAGATTVALVLADAVALPDTNVPGGRRDPFLLTFQSAGQDVWPQGIYTVAHPALGTHDIFIVPVARDAASVTYQAVFN